MKTRLVSAALWASYVLTMAASISHVAATFNTLQAPGDEWAGWASAVAVDCGLAALAYAIQQRRRAKRPARSLWAGVLVLAGVSAYANTLHALAVSSADVAKAVILSAILPLLVVYMGEIISADDAAAADAAERQRVRDERRADRLAQTDAPPVTPVAPAVTSVAPPAVMSAPVSQVARYAADNGVSIRTAYRHLARASANGNGVAHD